MVIIKPMSFLQSKVRTISLKQICVQYVEFFDSQLDASSNNCVISNSLQEKIGIIKKCNRNLRVAEPQGRGWFYDPLLWDTASLIEFCALPFFLSFYKEKQFRNRSSADGVHPSPQYFERVTFSYSHTAQRCAIFDIFRSDFKAYRCLATNLFFAVVSFSGDGCCWAKSCNLQVFRYRLTVTATQTLNNGSGLKRRNNYVKFILIILYYVHLLMQND